MDLRMQDAIKNFIGSHMHQEDVFPAEDTQMSEAFH